MGTNTLVYLPDGQQQILPIAPKTWVDAGPTTPGDALRARLLETDAGGGVMWHRQRPLFQGFPTLAQSIPSGTFTAITGLSELVDNYAGHSDTTNTGRYYVPLTNSNTTGGDWYLCSGYVPFNSADATTPFAAGLRDTGSATINEGGKIPSGTGHVVDVMALDLMQLHGGNNDYIELVARQVTGAAVNTIVSGKSPSLTVRWVAADPAWSGFATPALPASPHTWTATDVYTGSATGAGKVPLNTELRDAVNFLNNPPIARLTSEGSAQTIPTGTTWTSIAFPTETVDSYNGHDNVTNNTRYTCQRAGLYLVAGLASIAETASNNGYRAVRLLVNGTTPYAGWTCLPQTAGTTGTAIYATALIRMAAGDYVETQMQQTQSAATRTINAAANNCARMIAVWMAA
jgi:hypothetical protein